MSGWTGRKPTMTCMCRMSRAASWVAVGCPRVSSIGRFHEPAARYAREPADVVAGIETGRGLFAGELMAAGIRCSR